MKNNQAVYSEMAVLLWSFTHFLMKLQEKKQTKAQQDQASHSILLYYEFRRKRGTGGKGGRG